MIYLSASTNKTAVFLLSYKSKKCGKTATFTRRDVEKKTMG